MLQKNKASSNTCQSFQHSQQLFIQFIQFVLIFLSQNIYLRTVVFWSIKKNAKLLYQLLFRFRGVFFHIKRNAIYRHVINKKFGRRPLEIGHTGPADVPVQSDYETQTH